MPFCCRLPKVIHLRIALVFQVFKILQLHKTRLAAFAKTAQFLALALINKLHFGKRPTLFIYSFFLFWLFPIWGLQIAKVFSIKPRLHYARSSSLLAWLTCLKSANCLHYHFCNRRDGFPSDVIRFNALL